MPLLLSRQISIQGHFKRFFYSYLLVSAPTHFKFDSMVPVGNKCRAWMVLAHERKNKGVNVKQWKEYI